MTLRTSDTDTPEAAEDAGLKALDDLGALPSAVRLRLPATSANLGPGFDALGLALSLFLTLEARPAARFEITATGRDAGLTGRLEKNLILTAYQEILLDNGCAVVPLALQVENDIPLGMGCGSSAAALCAGVMLAVHFGGLPWSDEQVLNEAARREGHPDNVAACLRGGLTASKMTGASPKASGHATAEREREGREDERQDRTTAVTLGLDLPWRFLLALPVRSVSTATARKLLPETYSRADAVLNVQSTAMLVSAFATKRPELLWAGMEDRLHQPYRMEICPLLPRLLPLAGQDGVFSATLSGAGPSVLLIVSEGYAAENVKHAAGSLVADVLEVRIAGGATLEELG